MTEMIQLIQQLHHGMKRCHLNTSIHLVALDRIFNKTKLKKGWCSRYKVLNQQKLLERFTGLPRKFISMGDKDILHSFLYEWNEVIVFFRMCITRQPKAITWSKTYSFGKEKLYVDLQSY